MEKSIRTGVIGKKIGMTRIFDQSGQEIPVTLIEVAKNFVVGNKNHEANGYNAVIVGFGDNKPHRFSKPLKGMFAKSGLAPLMHVKEFRVSADNLIESGKEISPTHWVVGQYVDVTSRSIGKGFAGSMKRHNFAGLEASHGVSISHRAHGSTGQRQDPGKVFKGKKMAGHMGDRQVTISNLQVVDVDTELGVVAVRGAVPGAVGAIVYLSDAIKKGLPYNALVPAAFVDSVIEKNIAQNLEVGVDVPVN
jgi:large subunit ribosomal protein L3